MKNVSHQTFSLVLTLNPLDAPAALGAGGIPLFCTTADGLSVDVARDEVRAEEPATNALDAWTDGVNLEAEGLYEKGGTIGKISLVVADGIGFC